MKAQQIEIVCLDDLVPENHPYRCFKTVVANGSIVTDA